MDYRITITMIILSSIFKLLWLAHPFNNYINLDSKLPRILFQLDGGGGGQSEQEWLYVEL